MLNIDIRRFVEWHATFSRGQQMHFQNQLSKLLLFGCIYFATVSFCDAQNLFGTGGAVMGLLRYKEVQNELKINDDQAPKLALIANEMNQEMRQALDVAMRNPRNAPSAEMMRELKRMKELRNKYDSELDDILDPNQLERLLGLLIQKSYSQSLSHPLIATRIQLTDEQKTKIAELESAHGEASQDLIRDKGGRLGQDLGQALQNITTRYGTKAANVLTEEQRKIMDSMKGDPFAFPIQQLGRGGIALQAGRGIPDRAIDQVEAGIQQPVPIDLDATLSGNVLFNGKKIEKGRILFYASDDQIIGCIILDGEYSIMNPATGNYTVTIDGPAVSAQYSTLDQSGLRAHVGRGKNQLDFNLTGR